MNSFIRYWILALLLTISTGCTLIGKSRSIVYAKVPFQFGTNATVNIEKRVRHTGNYFVYVLLFREEQQLGNKDWPAKVPTDLSISILADGRMLVDKVVTELRLGRHGWEGAHYIVQVVQVESPTVLSVRLTDRWATTHALSEVSLWLSRGK
jgi:hypothetical protein